MNAKMLHDAFRLLCERMEEIRKFPFIDSVIANADDQITAFYINEYREGDRHAASQLIDHAPNIFEHLREAGYGDEDEVYLAEIAHLEAISAQRCIRVSG